MQRAANIHAKETCMNNEERSDLEAFLRYITQIMDADHKVDVQIYNLALCAGQL